MTKTDPLLSVHAVHAPVVRTDACGRRIVSGAGKTFLLYQVYYDTRSARRLDPLCTPRHNPELGPFFESSVIADLLAAAEHRAADYFGVLSWKYRAKIPLAVRTILARIERDACSHDVYSFFGRVCARRLWPAADRKHPGILNAAQLLMQRLGVDVDLARLQAPAIYQNHFIARSSLYERFGSELLAPALRAMQDPDDVRLQQLIRQDAAYRDPRLTEAQVMRLYGRPYLCMHPFISERLFSTWLAINRGVRLRHIWHGRFVERRNVAHEPEMRHGKVPP